MTATPGASSDSGAESEGSDDQLYVQALDTATARLAALDKRVDEVVAERDRARREVQLLTQLLEVRDGTDRALAAPDPAGPSERLRGGRAPHPSVERTVRALERAGKPLHISELMGILQAEGVPVPGAGAQANLIAHLTRHPDIVRPSRGMYGLRSWGIDAPPLKRAARKRVKGPSRRDRK